MVSSPCAGDIPFGFACRRVLQAHAVEPQGPQRHRLGPHGLTVDIRPLELGANGAVVLWCIEKHVLRGIVCTALGQRPADPGRRGVLEDLGASAPANQGMPDSLHGTVRLHLRKGVRVDGGAAGGAFETNQPRHDQGKHEEILEHIGVHRGTRSSRDHGDADQNLEQGQDEGA